MKYIPGTGVCIDWDKWLSEESRFRLYCRWNKISFHCFSKKISLMLKCEVEWLIAYYLVAYLACFPINACYKRSNSLIIARTYTGRFYFKAIWQICRNTKSSLQLLYFNLCGIQFPWFLSINDKMAQLDREKDLKERKSACFKTYFDKAYIHTYIISHYNPSVVMGWRWA